jgi:hypothetical protein
MPGKPAQGDRGEHCRPRERRLRHAARLAPHGEQNRGAQHEQRARQRVEIAVLRAEDAQAGGRERDDAAEQRDRVEPRPARRPDEQRERHEQPAKQHEPAEWR